MLFDVWLINAGALSPYSAGTWLGRWFGANNIVACQAAANATGNSINSLQATPVVQSSFIWNPGYHQ